MKNSKLQFKIHNFKLWTATFNFELLTLNFCQKRAGFTLIEILLGMGLFVALVAAVIAIQSILLQSEAFSLRTMMTIGDANASLRNITGELRNARQSENGSFPLEEASDQQIVFYSNVDNDVEIERIRYFLDGTEFKKGTIDPTGFPPDYLAENEVIRIVAENIQNNTEPVFYYYNQDWPIDQVNNPLTTPASLTEVTLVKISVRVNADPTQPEGEYVLEPFVQIRRLKSNL